jgi:sensor histidine kinase YesM
MQVHPHFLFNTLHAVSALIPKDPKAADVMLSRLSDLLRLTVEQSGVQEVPWREEQAALDRYLDIMRVRLGDRLRLRLDVSPEAREALVPSFLLQPIVENAVRYAISSRPEGGEIILRAKRQGADLLLSVEDDGPGFSEPPEILLRKGLGLANTAERLRSLYGTDQEFTLENRETGGARVVIRIPFRPA